MRLHESLWLCRSQQTGKCKEMGIPDHLICLLRNLHASQEATARTGHGTTDWFQTGKGVHQGCILSPYLFNLHSEYILRNTRLDEAQAGIKISKRNISNLRQCRWYHPYGRKQRRTKEPLDESERGEQKCWLKLNNQKMKIMASGLIISWQIDIDGETMETGIDFIFWAPKSLHMVTAAMKLKDACSLEEKLWQT